LEAEETKPMEMAIERRDVASLSDEETEQWIIEQDYYDVLVGNNSVTTPL